MCVRNPRFYFSRFVVVISVMCVHCCEFFLLSPFLCFFPISFFSSISTHNPPSLVSMRRVLDTLLLSVFFFLFFLSSCPPHHHSVPLSHALFACLRLTIYRFMSRQIHVPSFETLTQIVECDTSFWKHNSSNPQSNVVMCFHRSLEKWWRHKIVFNSLIRLMQDWNTCF